MRSPFCRATCETQGPSKTTRLIGRECTHSNVFSLPVLIGREAWPQNNLHEPTSVGLRRSFQIVYGFETGFSGGDGEEATPVTIPNTEVKLFSADGTAREAVWESRTPPENLSKGPEPVNSVPGLFSGLEKSGTSTSAWAEQGTVKKSRPSKKMIDRAIQFSIFSVSVVVKYTSFRR